MIFLHFTITCYYEEQNIHVKIFCFSANKTGVFILLTAFLKKVKNYEEEKKRKEYEGVKFKTLILSIYKQNRKV